MTIDNDEDYTKAVKKYNIMKDHYQDNDEQKEFIALHKAIFQYEEEQRGGPEYPNSHLY